MAEHRLEYVRQCRHRRQATATRRTPALDTQRVPLPRSPRILPVHAMKIALVGCVVVLLFSFLGYRRGLLRILTFLVSLLAAGLLASTNVASISTEKPQPRQTRWWWWPSEQCR